MRTLLLWLPVVLPWMVTGHSAPALVVSIAPSLVPLAGATSVGSDSAAAEGDTKVVSVPGLERIVILGASLSDGFGLDPEVGARTVLADVVEAALKSGHDPVLNKASGFFFMDPAKAGREEVEGARAKNPTLVVGLDYLFWFGYGRVRVDKVDKADQSESADTDDKNKKADQIRLARFESGLVLLEGFTCPVLVGDLPDMSQALEGESPLTRGPLLRRDQIPAPAMLAQLNQRLTAWAEQRTNVIVVPIAKLLARLHAQEEITLRGNVWRDEAAKELFQKDLLHPTLQGSVAVWLFAQDCLVRAEPVFPAEAFEWNADAIGKKVYAAKEPERAAKLEKARQEKERSNARSRSRAPSPKEPAGNTPPR